MDEQWLREWSADEVEYPPKRLREEVGELLAELDAARGRLAALEAALRNLADSLPASAAYVTSSTPSALREARRALDAVPVPAAETGSGEPPWSDSPTDLDRARAALAPLNRPPTR